MFQALVVINLALVHVWKPWVKLINVIQINFINAWIGNCSPLTDTRIYNGIQLEALLAVAVKATRVVDTNLIAITSTLVDGALVNIDALVATPPESHLAAHLSIRYRIPGHIS